MQTFDELKILVAALIWCDLGVLYEGRGQKYREYSGHRPKPTYNCRNAL